MSLVNSRYDSLLFLRLFGSIQRVIVDVELQLDHILLLQQLVSSLVTHLSLFSITIHNLRLLVSSDILFHHFVIE